MTLPVPLTKDERAFLVSNELTIRQMAAQFQCTRSIIERVRRQIRNGVIDVYIFLPPPKPRKTFRKNDTAIVCELRECALGMDPVGACEKHLVDLNRWHAPLRSHRIPGAGVNALWRGRA